MVARGNWATQKDEAPSFRVQGCRLETPCSLDQRYKAIEMHPRICDLSSESLSSMVGIYDRRAWLTGLTCC